MPDYFADIPDIGSDYYDKGYDIKRLKHWKTVISWLHAQFVECSLSSGCYENPTQEMKPSLSNHWFKILTGAMDAWEVKEGLQNHILRSFEKMVTLNRPADPDDVLEIEETMLLPIDSLIYSYASGFIPLSEDVCEELIF